MKKFQTLPGIIPRFYFKGNLVRIVCRELFQTLPGIIPRFYAIFFDFFHHRYYCFKPFQGLFRVST
ncbi:hypothetical protein U27_06329 [Candidatus Vecturithrix granuli]|uniref:Uncharacterized protein n=1 Tax=Vecturithrix granuli TaxID=1499967 RepID=A0A081C440_VECG1|nr:hypothetical protein U27_06329 [Candidatus Vecturithrix granuli]